MKKWYVLILLGGLLLPSISPAIDLKQSKFTQVVNNVEIISADHTRHTAAVNDIFSMPDVLRTGPDSRAELDAVDGTITRVGANTIFSFDPLNRTIDLQQGSLLFHSPKGKGGGTIRTGSATASVIGTTIIITATQNGGFKLLDLEGQAEVRFLNGINQTLEPGQMTFILPSGQTSPILVFRLDSETKGSTLVSGFNTPLDSQSKINSEITQQLLQILNGTAADTGLLVGDNATPTTVQVVQSINNSSPPSQPSSTPPPPIFSTDGSIVGSDHVNNLVDANDKPLLPKNYSPLDPAHTFDGSITPLTSADIAGINSIDSFSQGLSFLGLTDPASGFFGNNIDIDTANVDLSSFAAKLDFDIMAKGDLRIWQSVNFTPGFSSPSVTSLDSGQPDVISLIAGGQMLIASGSTLEADTTTFGLVAGGFGTLDTSTALADSDYPDALENLHIVNNDGAIQILSLSDFTLEDYSTIYAGNDGTGLGLEIESDGNLTLGYNGYSLLSGPSWNVLIHSAGDVDLTAGGKIGIYDTEVNATGGDIKITAGGNVDIENSYLPASSPESLLAAPAPGATGSVIITGAGVDVEYTSISAGGDVGIEGSGTLYLGWNRGGDEISAGSSVSLTSDNGDVDVSEYDIYADGSDENGNGINISAGGNVDVEDSSEIYAYDGGVSISGDDSVYLYNDDIEAGEDTDGLYDLDVISYGSTVDIDDTYLYASGSVNIESGDTLTIEDDADIKAYDGAVSLKSDNADVDITDSDVYADYGAVNINAGGNVYLSDSDIESGWDTSTAYDVDINAGGTIDLEGTYAYATGDLNIESGGTLTLGQSSSDTVEAAGNVNLTSDNADVDSYGYDVYADFGAVSISAGGNVYLSSSDIESGWDTSTAYDVDINAVGTIDLEDTYVYATGDLNIESGDTLTLGQNGSDTVEAAGNVNLTSDNADVDSYGYDVYADYGAVSIKAGGNVDIEGGEIYAYDDVTIASSTGFAPSSCVRGNVDINDAEIYAGYDVSYDEIPSSYDGGFVTIDAWKGHVDLYDDEIYAYSGEYNDGDITIYANGSVDVDGTELFADGDVNIESANTLTVEDSSEIYSYGLNGISLTSDNADVDVSASSLFAYNGDVTISGSGTVGIYNDSTIDAAADASLTSTDGGDVNVESSYVYGGDSDFGGSVTVDAEDGNVLITGSTLSASDDVSVTGGGDVTISGSTITANNGLVDIEIGGNLTVGMNPVSESEVASYDTTITAGTEATLTGSGEVDITDASIAAGNDVSITSDGSVSFASAGTLTVSESYSADNIDVSGSSITSDNGNVSIINNGSFSVSGTTISISGSDINLDNISISDSTITADNGGVLIEFDGQLNRSDSTAFTITGSTITLNDISISGSSITAGEDIDIWNYHNEINSGPDAVETDNISDEVNNIYILSGSTITSNDGNVDVLTQNGGIDLENSTLSAANGFVHLNADSGLSINSAVITAGEDVNIDSGSDSSYSFDGNMYLSGDTITAGTDATISGDGNVSIDGSTIKAVSGLVDIESGGTLTLGQSSSGTVEAAGNVNLTSDNADVDSYGYDVYADNGAVNINAGGNVYLSSSDIESGYNSGTYAVDINAAGTIDLEGTYVYATGDLNIESGGTLTLGQNSSDTVEAAGNVNLTSDNADVDSYGYDVYADYGAVSINAGGNVYLSDSDIESGWDTSTAYDVDINAGGTIDLEDAYVYATGDLNIESGGTLTLGQSSSDTVEATGNVNLTSDNADVDSYGYDLYSDYGAVNINAGGNVDIEGGEIYAYDDVTIASSTGFAPSSCGRGNVDINDAEIYAGYDVSYDEIPSSYDGGSVTIDAWKGHVDLYDDDIEAYSGEYSDGHMTIYANGSVDVDDTELYADGDVNIESANTLTVEDSSEIDSYGLAGISLTSDNADVDVYDSEFYAYNGSVNVGASGNVNIENSDIYAFDNVNITSSTGSAPAPDAFSPAPGSVDIEYSYIYAGYNNTPDEISDSTDGGSVNITAWSGDVDLYDDEIYAYSGLNIGTGDVNIYASGSVDLDDVYRLYADDSIEIEGVNTVTVEDGSDLDAYNGDVSLTSDNADVDITDSEIYSDYGNVNIKAAGSVYMSDGNIQAGYYSDTIGDVVINAHNGTADFENTDIEAAGGVYIESSGTLTLNYTAPSDDVDNNSEIYAGGGLVSLKSDYGNVDIYNYDVNAEGGDLDINAGGGPSLTCSDNSGGNVDIENTDFQVSGSAYVNATGNVYVDNSYFDMYEGGDVNVNAGGNIDVLYTDGSSGSGSVNLTAGGYVNVYDYALNMGSFDVTAGTYADFGADQSVEIYGSTIAANGGDVNITGNSAGVDIDSTTITGTGDINITAGGGYHVDSLSSGGHVAPAYVAPSAAAGAFVVLGTFTPETFVEPAPISAASDYIDENGADIEDAGTLDLEANIDANIQNNSSLVSDSGNVMVNSGGTEEVDSSYIDANGSVYLTAVGSVSLSDSLASSDIYSDIYADNGDVDIQSSGSTVDIEKTYIYAHGSVNIESSDTLTLGYNGGNTIEVYDGDVSLTSDNADVDAYNYSIYSDYGNVNISAGGNVFLSDDYIYSGYDTDAGNVNIQSLAGSVDIEGTYISAAGNVGIISYGTLTLGNTSGYEIYADGWANLSSTTGDVDINGYRIYTYGSDVDGNGLTISAAVGSLNISGDSFSAYDNGDVNMSALGAGSTVDINDTYIYAGGDVNIESSGTLTVENSSTIESYGNNGISLKSDLAAVDLNDSSLYAYNGDVNIAAPGVSGTIDLEDTYISAFGNVNIESSGTLTLGSVSAWTIDAGNAISLKSDNADVDIYNDYEIDADGSDINGNGITISAGGNVDIENDGDIYADYGGVKIAAAGSVYLYDDEIYAGYDDTDYGNMNITSSGSTVDVDNTYLNAEGDVSVESSDMLTVENSSEIDSYGYNGISLTSDNADVDVNDSSLYAYYGNVNITAIATSAEIDLQSDDISAYGNVNIESDGTLTMGNSETGGDTIYAGSGIYLSSNNGDVDVYNSTIDGGFANNNDGFNGIVNDITIHDGSTITADTAVNLNAYGATVSIYAPYGNIYIGDTTINPGGGIGITDSTITANGHDINGNGVSIYSDGYFYVGGRSDTLFNDDIEGNNISIDGSAITANNGGISIVNDAYASTADAIGFNIDNTTLIYGDINISSGSTITADDGSLNISTASLELFNASSAYSSDISLNDISIYDSTIEAIGGNVTVSAGGYLTTGTEIVSPDKRGISAALLAPYAVSINASGDISLYGYSGVDLDVTTAEAGGKLDLESDNYVDVYNSSLTSDTGHLDIYGDYGNVDVEYSTIKATLGNVDIEAGYDDFTYDYNNETLTLFGDTITAGGSVTLSTPGGVGILDVSTVGMTVDDVGITADSISLLTHYHAIDLDVNDFGSSTLTARTGDADIYADNGDVDVQGSTIKATLGNVNIGAGFTDVNNYNVEQLTLNGVTITAGEAASLTSSGGIHVDDSDITAASITLETLYGVANLDVNDFGSSTLTAGTGDADIYADNGKVDIEGSTINATLGNVNIGAGYTDDPDYNSETLTLNGGSIIAGEAVTLTAQSDVDVNVDNSDTTTLTAGSGDVSVTSYYGNVDVENSTVTAGGSVTLTAPGTVTLNNGSLTGNNSITYGVNVNAGTGITINGTAITADDPTYGIYLTSSAGMTTIQNGASMTGNLTINSPDGILIDGSHGGTISGSTMNLTAGGGDILGGPAINVNNEDFSTFQTVNMSAHTINLTDVAFGGSSIVNLHSFLGLLALFPNTGAASVPGEVNFITGVTYGGVAAQLRIGSGINISGL